MLFCKINENDEIVSIPRQLPANARSLDGEVVTGDLRKFLLLGSLTPEIRQTLYSFGWVEAIEVDAVRSDSRGQIRSLPLSNCVFDPVSLTATCTYVWTDEPIVQTREQAIDIINNKANEIVNTKLSSTLEVVSAKVFDADNFIRDGRPTTGLGNYPMVLAEATARDITNDAAADLIISRYRIFRVDLAQIEVVRMQGIDNINNATTRAEGYAFLDATLSNLEALRT